MGFKERELHIIGAPISVRPSWIDRYDLLFTAIIRVAVLDYAKAICLGPERKVRELEKWFHSDGYSSLTRVPCDTMMILTKSVCEDSKYDFRIVRKRLGYDLCSTQK